MPKNPTEGNTSVDRSCNSIRMSNERDEAVDSAMGGLNQADAAKWEEAQSRAFLHWINMALKRREMKVTDLLTGFESGVNLINFVEILTGKNLTKNWSKNPNLRVHKITNCFLALEHLKENGAKGLLISAENIVNCERLNMLLGFCWQTLRVFPAPAQEGGGSKDGSADFGENLLNWVKKTLAGYEDIDLKDGYKSEAFKSGRVFAGLINEFDESALDYKSLGRETFTYEENNKLALSTAESKLGIPSILEADQLASGKCNEKQLQLYLSLLYNSFSEKDRGMTKEVLMKKVQELEGVVVTLTHENTQLKDTLSQAEQSFHTIEENLMMTTEEHNKVRKVKDDASTQLLELQEEYSKMSSTWNEELTNLRNQKAKLAENSDQAVIQLDNQLEETTKNRDALRDELRKAKEELQKEREELEAHQKKLITKLDRTTKSKQELETIKEGSDKAHEKSLPSLAKNIIQHTTDLNPWANILEEDREFKYKNVTIPGKEIHSQEFLQQMQSLRDLVYQQNVNFENLLNDRSKEKQEVISVAMGKLKKREKTKQELEMEAESGQVLDDSEEEVKLKKEKSKKVKSSDGGDDKKSEKRGFVKATSPRTK